MSSPVRTEPSRLLAPGLAATTTGLFALIAFAAFEAMAVTTVMPTVARDLDGFDYYALAFAAPFASGVVGMVASGMWSDRSGALRPLFTSMTAFSLGLVVCGTAPSMDVLVAGRVLQGLGSGAMVVAIYVVVGLVYPASLRAAVFASFAAAWVLPALFGPAVAAFVADTVGWRWVFLGTVALVVLAAVLVGPSVRALPTPETSRTTPGVQLWWAALAAVSVLALELLGSGRGPTLLAAVVAFVLAFVALRPLLPAGALVARRGLPAVIVTRGLLSAAFFCAEAYIVYALQERWDLTPGQAGLALTCVGVVWAASSQVSSRLGDRVGNLAAMTFGTTVVLVGVTGVALTVLLRSRGGDLPSVAPMAAYVLASVGMGFAYPRTGVAMLAETTDADRGFNSSALSVADSLGAALALSLSGIVYAVAVRSDVDPFPLVYAIAVGIAALGVLAARRTAPRAPHS